MKKIIFSTFIALINLAFVCMAQTSNTPLKPEQILDLRGLGEVQIAPDAERIALTVTEPTTEAENKKQEAKDDARVVEKDERLARLWMIDIATRQTRQLTNGKWKVSEFGWMPSGAEMIVTATDKYAPERFTNRIYSL